MKTVLSRGTALVTGATGGIGGSVSRLLVEHGISVVAVGRDSGRLAEFATSSHQMLHPMPCDLADDAAVQRLGDNAVQRHPDLDVVVLAAGAIKLGAISTLTALDWDRMFAVNVRANARLLGILGPTLKANGGQVVLISSLAVTSPRAENAAYAATKAALGIVAEGFRDEHAGQVRITTVMPGRTDTAMQQYVMEMEDRALESDQLLDPDDVAHAVVDVVLRPSTVDVTEIRIRPTLPAT
jgi:NADP-dependent 3-hydroxy acid dehydrogenase YdfG